MAALLRLSLLAPFMQSNTKSQYHACPQLAGLSKFYTSERMWIILAAVVSHI